MSDEIEVDSANRLIADEVSVGDNANSLNVNEIFGGDDANLLIAGDNANRLTVLTTFIEQADCVSQSKSIGTVDCE
jgi:hypothetical protein